MHHWQHSGVVVYDMCGMLVRNSLYEKLITC